MAKLKVQMTGPQTGKVWLDGIELTNVTGVQFGVDVKRRDSGFACAVITQTVYGDVEIEGEMDVTVLDNSGVRSYRARGHGEVEDEQRDGKAG